MAEGEGSELYIFQLKAPLCNYILLRRSPDTCHPNKFSKSSPGGLSLPRQCEESSIGAKLARVISSFHYRRKKNSTYLRMCHVHILE